MRFSICFAFGVFGLLVLFAGCNSGPCPCDGFINDDAFTIRISLYDAQGNYLQEELIGDTVEFWIRNKAGIPEKVQNWVTEDSSWENPFWHIHRLNVRCFDNTIDFLVVYNSTLQVKGTISFTKFYGGSRLCCRNPCNSAYISRITYGNVEKEFAAPSRQPAVIRIDI